MSKKTFTVYKALTAMALGIIVGVSANSGNWYLPAIFTVAAFVFLFTLKKKVKEALVDERDRKAAGKAHGLAMTIYGMLSVVIGLILFITGKDNPIMFAAGDVLIYSACFLMILYAILFKIFINRDERN